MWRQIDRWSKTNKKTGFQRLKETHVAVFVRYVVGKFHFMKRDCFLHPLCPSARGIRMHVQWFRHLRISLARLHPSTVMKLVSNIVHGLNVHEKKILRSRVQAGHACFNRRKHSPVDRKTKTVSHGPIEINMGDEINNGSWSVGLMALHLRSQCVHGGIV